MPNKVDERLTELLGTSTRLKDFTLQCQFGGFFDASVELEMTDITCFGSMNKVVVISIVPESTVRNILGNTDTILSYRVKLQLLYGNKIQQIILEEFSK